MYKTIYNLVFKLFHSKGIILLDILSYIYQLILLIKLKKTNPVKLRNAKVISIGNITLGGTGKTECVLSLAKYLISRGLNIAIVTRGYGKDELNLLKYILPKVKLVVGKDRVNKIKQVQDNSNIDLFILDDGYQYIRLHRDLDIVLINCLDAFGNFKVFPAGILREPLTNLNRADIIILTKSDLVDEKTKQRIITLIEKNSRADCRIYQAIHKPIALRDSSGKKFNLESLYGKRVLAVSSIADSLSFELLLKRTNPKTIISLAFPDHYTYTKKDISYIENTLGKKADLLVTTKKDMLKLKNFLKNILYLDIEFFIPNHNWKDIIRCE